MLNFLAPPWLRVPLEEPRILVDSTAPVTLESVEDYAAVSGDCIVQVPEVRLRVKLSSSPRALYGCC